MGVARRVVEWLRDQGHDARHLREEELQRLPDDQIFRKAVAENRVVLTLDLDFGEIVCVLRTTKRERGTFSVTEHSRSSRNRPSARRFARGAIGSRARSSCCRRRSALSHPAPTYRKVTRLPRLSFSKGSESMRSRQKYEVISSSLLRGSYGTGKRIKLADTREIIDAIHNGALAKARTKRDL